MLAVDLADAALAVARDGRLLSCAPSVVFDGSTAESPGTPAWQALRRTPTAVSSRHLMQLLRGEPSARAAALLTAELAQALGQAGAAQEGEGVWFAAPAQATPAGLSALLAISRALDLGVQGFVDAATAQVAALGLTQPALVLEAGLHHLAVTLVERGGEHCSARRVVGSPAAGWLELLASWAALAGRTLVQQTRFDPLHEAVSEQLLYDALPALVEQAQSQGAAPVSIPGHEGQVMISRDQLGEAASGLRREIMRLLQGLRTGGRSVSLVAPASLLGVPGLAEDLESLSGCELIEVPAGFAAQATGSLALPARGAGEPVRLLRRLPARAAGLTAGVSRRALGERRAAAPPPSHILLDGQAHPLPALATALVVGCEPGEGGVLRLGPGLAGVSRRHCTFLRSGGEVVLLDHSRYGTYVNGERVAERVRVHAGDRVRLGDPGVTLALIAVPM